MKYLVVFIQITLAHSKFDIELCWEIKRDDATWKSAIIFTPVYLIMPLFFIFLNVSSSIQLHTIGTFKHKMTLIIAVETQHPEMLAMNPKQNFWGPINLGFHDFRLELISYRVLD